MDICEVQTNKFQQQNHIINYLLYMLFQTAIWKIANLFFLTYLYQMFTLFFSQIFKTLETTSYLCVFDAKLGGVCCLQFWTATPRYCRPQHIVQKLSGGRVLIRLSLLKILCLLFSWYVIFQHFKPSELFDKISTYILQFQYLIIIVFRVWNTHNWYY